MQYRNAGALVGPTVPIVRLISGDVLWVRFAVPAADADALALDAPVAVDVADLEIPLRGTVREIAPEVDPASRRIFVEAELHLSDERRSRVRSGMNAWVRLGDTDATP
jgi:membrane fusion protein (multidrug efflux system)/multidrug efflux system membrane fusion protein